MARKPETIFVQIASYRDPDLLNTLKDIPRQGEVTTKSKIWNRLATS